MKVTLHFKKRVDNPLSHWSEEAWVALWCALFNGSVVGNNDNRNRAHILRHYCNISDKAKMNFYGLNRGEK